MKKKVNAEEANVVEEVKDTVKRGLAVINMVKGDSPEEDRLESKLYVGTDDSFEVVKTLDGTDLTTIMNESIDRLIDEGITTDYIDVTYHHSLVGIILSQEIQLSRSNMIDEIKSMKASYEAMNNNQVIELSADQVAQVSAGIKVIDKLMDKFEPKTEGGE